MTSNSPTREAGAKYAAMIDAVVAQRSRAHGGAPDVWGGRNAQMFRANPRREMDSNFDAIARYVEADDVFIDVGGGAGRFSLPMALRCQQVINVDSSHGMGVEFQASATEAGIANAKFIRADWLDPEQVQGDVSLAANVTCFVNDIEEFIRRLDSATRRRVIINISSLPNPNHYAKAFRLVYGEDLELAPGHTQLLPVLWEMGILPDVVVLPRETTIGGAPVPVSLAQTPQGAVEEMLGGVWMHQADRERARELLREHFSEFYRKGPEGFVSLWRPAVRQMLITWQK